MKITEATTVQDNRFYTSAEIKLPISIAVVLMDVQTSMNNDKRKMIGLCAQLFRSNSVRRLASTSAPRVMPVNPVNQT